MANTAVEVACSKCGAEIREGSVYCYGCGSPVAEVAKEEFGEKPSAPEPAAAERSEVMSDLELAHSSAVAQAPQRSRPTRRKPARVVEPKVVEVVWQEPSSGSWRFIVSALIIVIIGLVLVGLGLYLR